MRAHLTNAAFGILDYASYPFGMLLVAPIVLHRLGAAEYGLWMIATAIISAGGIIASGFCDAGMQRVARLRGEDRLASIARTVRTMLSVNLVLGSLLGAMVWLASPYAARHIATSHLVSLKECLVSVRLGGVLIVARAVESAGIATHRAFEQYRNTVQISSAVRLLILACAAALALAGRHTVSILIATGGILAIGAWMQFRQLRRFFGDISLRPALYREEARLLLRPGAFAWLQSAGGVIFGQLDRIMLGISLGAFTVAPYVLCVQFAQPIIGVNASGLHFLFPYLSRRAGAVSPPVLHRMLRSAFLVNLLIVACIAGPLLLFGDGLIRLWAGAAVAQQGSAILPAIVAGSSLMALSVTGTYAMQALGLFRTVAAISLSARTAMLLLMLYLLRHMGLHGLVLSRLCYGLLSLAIYWPLLRRARRPGNAPDDAPAAVIACELQEGLKS